MVNVAKEHKGNVLVIKVAGAIEENVNFDSLIGTPPPEMHVYLREVDRINSVGLRAWIQYFTGAKNKGIKFKFVECSAAIVEQIKSISNFTCGGEVESIVLPFCCTKCRAEMMPLFKTSDLKKMNFELPAMKCEECGGNAVFDDIAEEYSYFLNH